MSELVQPVAEWCAAVIEVLGVGMITLAAFYALFFALYQRFFSRRAHSNVEAYFDKTRQHLGRGILLGLEFLVAADIIHTVAVELTFTTVGVLAVVVLIRTFLSFTLDVELTGKWPWQRDHAHKAKEEVPDHEP
jgi:uncharacterized membrane protein